MIEQFYGSVSSTATATCGTTLTWVDSAEGMGIVPVVGVCTSVDGHLIQVALLSDPELVRQLANDLLASISYLENAPR